MEMKPRWDDKNRRWEVSVGSGKNRTWFRSRIQGDDGRKIVELKRENYLHGPKPLRPGCLAEFIETVWWPRVKAGSTHETLRRYRYDVQRFLSPFFDMQLNDLRLDVLQAWVNGMDGKPKTIRNRFGLMASILELARMMGKYLHHDHKLVVLPEIVRVVRRDLTTGKVRALLAAAKGTEMEGPIWAAGYLGVRRNEACGLKRPHVTIDGAIARIGLQDNRQPHGESDKLKSKPRGEKRVLTVPAELAEKLLSFGSPDSLYLFNYNGKPIHPDRITKQMPALCEAAGIEKMEFRELRAACRSNLKAAGVPEVDIMRILGHSNYKTSLMYQDERDDAQIDAFKRMMEL